MRLQRKKDAAESGRRGTRCYSESISPEDRERIALGASGSTGYSYHQRQSANGWEYARGSWKLKKNQRTGDTAAIAVKLESYDLESSRTGPIRKCSYERKDMPNSFYGGTEVRWPGKKRFIDWVQYKGSGVAMDANTGAAERKSEEHAYRLRRIRILNNPQRV